MNLHKYSEKEIFEIRLRRGLMNWLGKKSPSADIRAQLLSAAAEELNPKVSLFARFVALSVGGEYTNHLSFERFAKSTAYSLQIGVLIL
ncbi:MAG: hypothetical protein ISR58_03655 [Anaerolineales bacterium]|nr:hypothetical protein [Chloroflexota bacterium]MBL6980268.1 hypothetical protein [Anaerolineales bacterium]